ncbi:DUF362 domain-containing protein [uncultured Turicimonas sp.]|uniref:DUF362 domain-containing protein n=1 Tax=uncultured Turicimonas sp. TaxID=1918607 RepID=UPI0032119FCA
MKRRKLLNNLGMLSLFNFGSHLASVLHAQENFLAGTPIANIRLPHLTEDKNAPVVFYSPMVSSEAMLKLLEASQYKLSGKVGIKMTFSNVRDSAVKIDPMLIKPLIENVKGTMIDSNYFDGARSNTQAHLATAKANGFDKAGPIDILDSEGEIALSVKGGYHLKTFITGAKLADYDSLISVVRFKGHNLPRYGGSMKNLSICLGTPKGAAQIHSGGKITDYFSSAGEKVTSESMADAVKAALDFKPGKWIFFNIIDSLEPQRRDACDGAKNIGDIGILLSTDPIACDQAAVDIVYGFAPDEQTRRQWEQEHFVESLEMAEKIGVGATHYRLQVVRNFMQ